MKKLVLAATAIALALPAAAQAATDVTINFGATNPIPAVNNFQGLLAGLGFTQYATTGASIFLNGPANIVFEFLGSESGFSDTFSTSSISLTENSSFEDHFGSPILIGTQFFAAGGSLAGLLNFTSSGGAAATIGQDGFGIFLGPNQQSGSNVTTFYFGYDDEITRQDDNHDDFIVRATVTSPVPEPATWAMMIVGFGIVGASVRRRQNSLSFKMASA